MKIELNRLQILGLAGAIVVALVALFAWREWHNAEQVTLERGRALEATAQAETDRAAAVQANVLAQAAADAADEQHQANAQTRRGLEEKIGQYKQRYEAAETKLKVSEQHYQDQVATIASLGDVQLAEFTVRQLRVLYDATVSFAPTSTGFAVDRPGVQLTLRAGLEVEHLRGVESAHNVQLASQAGQIQTWEQKAATWADDFAKETVARQAAEGATIQWRNSSESFRRAAERWQNVDAATKRKDRWRSVKDALITGGLAGAGILAGDKYGYAFAGGVVGSYVIRRVF